MSKQADLKSGQVKNLKCLLKLQISQKSLQKWDLLPKNENSIYISSCYKQSEGMKSCPVTLFVQPALHLMTELWMQEWFPSPQKPSFWIKIQVFGRTRPCDVEERSEMDIQFPPTQAVFLILFYLETDLTYKMHKKFCWWQMNSYYIGRQNKAYFMNNIWKASETDPTVSTKHTQQ